MPLPHSPVQLFLVRVHVSACAYRALKWVRRCSARKRAVCPAFMAELLEKVSLVKVNRGAQRLKNRVGDGV
jgi:hypothetical protein